MLHFIDSNPQFDRRLRMREMDILKSTWVVSDLETKTDIQNILFEKSDFLPEDAVLRASEVWLKLLVRVNPNWSLVSSSLFETLLQDWILTRDINWASGPGAAKTLGQYLQQFLPIFLDDGLSQQFREWLGANNNALIRFGRWFLLAKEAWEHFSELKMAPSTWVPALLLQDHSTDLKFEGRQFVFDLEAQLSGIEVELIRHLAEKNEVYVIVPDKTWRSRHPKVLWPYSILVGEAVSHDPRRESDGHKLETLRWTTPMAEVKGVTAQVRKWLDSGIDPQKIAIVAPNIEEYWPALSAYFSVEGVPVKKDKVAQAQTFKDVAGWLARLKVEAQNFESSDVQQYLYSNKKNTRMPYAQFRALFHTIFEVEDLGRDQEISRLFALDANSSTTMSRDQFVSWSLQRWDPEAEYDRIEKIFSALLSETPRALKMKLESWLGYLQKLCAKLEIRIQPRDEGGVHFVNFGAGLFEKWDRIFIIGLSDKAVKSNSQSTLATSDLFSIGQDLGLYLEHPDKSEAEFAADWLSSKRDGAFPRQTFLSFSGSDFSGDPQAPALLWLESALGAGCDIEHYQSPESTRWDDIQKLESEELARFHSRDQIESKLLFNAVQVEKGLEPIPPTVLSKRPTLSASQLERYLICPFIFLAEKVWGLVDFAEVDFDVDHMSKGRLEHALLEKLLAPPVRYNWNEQELSELIDEIKAKHNIFVADNRLWPSLRLKYIRVAQRFLNFEQEWRRNYPATDTVARELKFEVGFDPVAKKFVNVKDAPYVVRGQIDRVDAGKSAGADRPGDGTATGEPYIVLDYKSAKSERITHATSWTKKGALQMALYGHLVEQGLTTLPPGELVGAFYYILKDMETGERARETGFRVDGKGEGLFNPASATRNKMSAEEKDRLLSEMIDVVANVIERMENGEFQPNPRDPLKDCANCRWRKTCRAPHLN